MCRCIEGLGARRQTRRDDNMTTESNNLFMTPTYTVCMCVYADGQVDMCVNWVCVCVCVCVFIMEKGRKNAKIEKK